MTEPTLPPRPSAAVSGPVITRSEATWRGERLFDAGPAGRTHRIDASAKEAPGPVESLLNALATCSAVDIIDIIAKRKTPVERMSVHVSALRRSEAPRRIVHLEIEYRVEGAGIEREHAERAVQLSYERYCSVASSLAPDIVVETSLTLNGEAGRPSRRTMWAPDA